MGLSNRGNEWVHFSDGVLEHIEKYTVPQYGDAPDDLCATMTVADIKGHLSRYATRIGNGARGHQEALRDCHKMAHYACMLHSKLSKENE